MTHIFPRRPRAEATEEDCRLLSVQEQSDGVQLAVEHEQLVGPFRLRHARHESRHQRHRQLWGPVELQAAVGVQDGSDEVIRQCAGSSEVSVPLEICRQRAQQRPAVHRGRVFLLLRQELQKPVAHRKAALRGILLGLSLLHPPKELLVVDCQRLVIQEILFLSRSDGDLIVRPCVRGSLVPLDVHVIWIVLVQPQESRSELIHIDFEGHLLRDSIAEGPRPDHDEGHVLRQDRQRCEELSHVLPEVADMTNVGQLSGARQSVHLHQRMD